MALWSAWRLLRATGEAPSKRLLDDSFDDCAKWDFDQAVILFGESIEGLLKETKEVPMREPPKKARHTQRVPVYTLPQLLGLDERDEAMTTAMTAAGAVQLDPDALPLDLSDYDYGEDE